MIIDENYPGIIEKNDCYHLYKDLDTEEDLEIKVDLFMHGKLVIDGRINAHGFLKSEKLIHTKGSINSNKYIQSDRAIISEGPIIAQDYIESQSFIFSFEWISSQSYIKVLDSMQAIGLIETENIECSNIWSNKNNIKCKSLKTRTLPFYREYYAGLKLLKKYKRLIMTTRNCWDEIRQGIEEEDIKEICEWEGWHPLIKCQVEMFLGVKDIHYF